MKKIFISIIILILGISLIGIADASPAPEPASVLVFPYFVTSSDPTITNSMVSITNINSTNDTCLRFTAFSYALCNEFNFDVCLTPNQISTIDLSYYFEGDEEGFLVVSAIYTNGTLRDFDYLIGNMYVKEAQLLPGGSSYAPIPIKKIADNQTLDSNGIIFFGETYTDIPKYLIEDHMYAQPDYSGYAQYLVITTSEDPSAAGYPSFNLFSFPNGNVRIELENYIWDDYEYYNSDYSDNGECGIHNSLQNVIDLTKITDYGWAEILRNKDATLGLTAGYNIAGVKISSNGPEALYASELHRSEEGVQGKLIISNEPVSEGTENYNGIIP